MNILPMYNSEVLGEGIAFCIFFSMPGFSLLISCYILFPGPYLQKLLNITKKIAFEKKWNPFRIFWYFQKIKLHFHDI